ncbi:MAG TPA: cupin domain-containing protein [Polyangia bacterium]|jgi:uncharacterized cupin superfamily protein
MPKIDLAAAPKKSGSSYPAPFDEPVRARSWQRLGDVAGLTQFGANLVRLPPGAWSSQRHWHRLEDELVWIVEGELVLVTDAGEETLRVGDCAGFKAGVRDGHHFQNRAGRDAIMLVVGSRVDGDSGEYSDIDMTFGPAEPGTSARYKHKDGRPY